MSTHKDDPTVITTTDRFPHGQQFVPLEDDVNGHGPQRVALVTGAGQGIGRAIAVRLAKDGFDMALSDIHSNRERLQQTADAIKSEAGRRVITVYADVSKEDDVKAMVDRVADELGGLDVMVANAGMAVLEDEPANMERTFSINVYGVVLCYKYAAKQMIKQGRGGRLIGACSIAGKRGDPNSAAYCASKFAVRGLSQSAAIELAPYGINVNCYAPGAIHTEFLDKVDEKYTEEEGKERGAYIKQRAEAIPLGRVGQPEDISGVVSFLAGPDSKFMTGQAITVDGGTLFD
ncbi:acetoin reductase family protein [Fomitopsis serialis]|uniref:acetoin reductase family protein n=1 Tax=Fomitopsis serialis TaxID=139415 RepID=UPI00200758F1|nr:acetoin reductase family protein [Neoantrodia serialis]KAH9928082.1 acetoin reductase family protein [Neoantrodia serialis]